MPAIYVYGGDPEDGDGATVYVDCDDDDPSVQDRDTGDTGASDKGDSGEAGPTDTGVSNPYSSG